MKNTITFSVHATTRNRMLLWDAPLVWRVPMGRTISYASNFDFPTLEEAELKAEELRHEGATVKIVRQNLSG